MARQVKAPIVVHYTDADHIFDIDRWPKKENQTRIQKMVADLGEKLGKKSEGLINLRGKNVLH